MCWSEIWTTCRDVVGSFFFLVTKKNNEHLVVLRGASTVSEYVSTMCGFDVAYHTEIIEKVNVFQYGRQIMSTSRKNVTANKSD